MYQYRCTPLQLHLSVNSWQPYLNKLVAPCHCPWMALSEASNNRLESETKIRSRTRRILSSNSNTSRSDSDLLFQHKSDDSRLKPDIVQSIMETGEEIGKGAFGVVYKIKRWGTICAAKKLHGLPLHHIQGNQDQSRGPTNSGNTFTKPSAASARPVSSSAGSVAAIKASGARTRAPACSARDKDDQVNRSSSDSASSSSTNSKGHNILAKFEKECHLLSNLRHPYIVQFLGVYIEKASGTPVIVMEYLPSSLSNLVKNKPLIPRYLHISILSNIALGLAYLHGHTPAIIHRDLTANNILLTSNLVAKIADLGVAWILDLTPKRALQTTLPPETAAYMPPELLAQNPSYVYSIKIDIFSFGVLSLHLISQVLPIPTESGHVVVNGRLMPISEVDRRKTQFDLMGPNHCLYQLTSDCLQNDPTQRPDISRIVLTMETLQSKFPLPSTSYLDLLQVRQSEIWVWLGVWSLL